MAKRSKTTSVQAPPDVPTHPAPIPFAEILGQNHAIDTIRGALDAGRLHHAWIFHGPPGVGKFTTALTLAALLLDPDAQPDLMGTLDIDPQTRVQALIAKSLHPDLHVVTKELARFHEDRDVRERKLTTIPKQVIEQHVLEPAALAATMREGSLAEKLFIIDEAELLDRSPTNAPVQNALLKTLEEPSPGTVIILVTSREDRLLPTIRSRCQRVRFGPLDASSMNAWLDRHDELALGPADRDWLLAFADGSPGVLQKAVEMDLLSWWSAIEPAVRAADQGRYDSGFGPTMTKLIDDWAGAWVKQDSGRSKEAANRVGASTMFAMLHQHQRPSMRGADAFAATRRADIIERAQHELGSNIPLAMVMDHLAAGLPAAR